MPLAHLKIRIFPTKVKLQVGLQKLFFQLQNSWIFTYSRKGKGWMLEWPSMAILMTTFFGFSSHWHRTGRINFHFRHVRTKTFSMFLGIANVAIIGHLELGHRMSFEFGFGIVSRWGVSKWFGWQDFEFIVFIGFWPGGQDGLNQMRRSKCTCCFSTSFFGGNFGCFIGCKLQILFLAFPKRFSLKFRFYSF